MYGRPGRLEDVTKRERERNEMPMKPATGKSLEIKLAHSPDSDDAFMFYGLATQKVKSPGLKFSHVLADIETLNQAATQEIYDVTALSFAAYPYLRDKYVLLDCGASFGEGYGPVVVSQRPLKRADLKKCRIGVPGLRTSAYLTLKLYEPQVEPVVMAFDQILDAVKNSVVDAGLLIHEGQLFFSQMGMQKVVDLGQWWLEQTGLPLPLGGNGVRRALGPSVGLQIARAINESVAYGLDHRESAVNYAMQFARDMDPELADKFIGMYVNKWTLGYGERGHKAVNEFLKRGVDAGLIPGPSEAEFLMEA
jgi:5,8-dihydroxy-2-naphthoate synthase